MLVSNPRLLFYAVNGLGLGHVTRLLAIARAVRRQCPDAQILFMTASEADDVIYKEGFAALKVPSKNMRAAAGLRFPTYAKLVQTVTWNAVAAFSPAALVVDTFPAGGLHELLPLLRWEMRRVFVYRVQQPEKARDPFFQNTLGLYDLALIPHTEGTEEMPLPPQMPVRLDRRHHDPPPGRGSAAWRGARPARPARRRTRTVSDLRRRRR